MTMESWIAIPMINLAAVGAMMTVGWIFSVLRRNVTIVDSLWGLGFVLVAGVTFWTGSGFGGRSLLILVLTAGWGLRLAGYLTRRNWGQPEDHRYGQWREKSGKRFWFVSLFKVFWLQALFLWIISLVLQKAQLSAEPSRITALDILGTVVWSVGFVFESVGDWQLARFKADPKNRGQVMDQRPVGLEPPPQLLRRIFNLVGFLPGGPGHTGRVVDNYQSYNYFHGTVEDDRGATDRSSP